MIMKSNQYAICQRHPMSLNKMFQRR